MKKRILNSAVFFVLLYWLVLYLVQRQSHFLSGAGWPLWLALAAGTLLPVALAKPLLPVFEAVLAVTARLGSLIFAAITAVVFFVLLTPLSLLMRLGGKRFMQRRFDRAATTYYEPWHVSEDPSKQF